MGSKARKRGRERLQQQSLRTQEQRKLDALSGEEGRPRLTVVKSGSPDEKKGEKVSSNQHDRAQKGAQSNQEETKEEAVKHQCVVCLEVVSKVYGWVNGGENCLCGRDCSKVYEAKPWSERAVLHAKCPSSKNKTEPKISIFSGQPPFEN